MEVALIIGLFVSTALSLNFLVNQQTKLSGMFDIINLCLTVAIAYQFKQIQNIMWVLIVAVIAVIVFFILKMRLKKNKENSHIVDAEMIEDKEED